MSDQYERMTHNVDHDHDHESPDDSVTPARRAQVGARAMALAGVALTVLAAGAPHITVTTY